MSESLLTAAALLDSGLLLVLAVYFIITLSDLECDYLNASACCEKLNKWVLPEVVAVCVIPPLLLFSGHWIMFLFLLPFPLFLANRYIAISAGSIGFYDPTEIHNRGLLKKYMKESMIKLIYNIVSFFVFLYCFIYSLVVAGPAVKSS